MGWARLDDNYYSHPKLLAAGLEASGLDCRAIAWAAQQGTDGFIPEAALPVITGGHRNPKAVAAKLVEVNRWRLDSERGGYWIHDFLDYNPSGEESKARKEAVRSARSEAGRKGAKARWQNGKPDGNGMATVDGTAIASGDGKAMAPSRPVPSLSTSQSSTNGCGAISDDDRLTHLWKAWAHRQLHKRRADGLEEPRSVAGWLTSVANDLAGQHLDAARALLAELPTADANELLDRLTAPPTPATRPKCDDCGIFLPARFCGQLRKDCEVIIRGVA